MNFLLNVTRTADLRAALEAERDLYLNNSHAFGGGAHVERVLSMKRQSDAHAATLQEEVERAAVAAEHDATVTAINAARSKGLAESPRGAQFLAMANHAIEAALKLADGRECSCTIHGSSGDPQVPDRTVVSVDF